MIHDRALTGMEATSLHLCHLCFGEHRLNVQTRLPHCTNLLSVLSVIHILSFRRGGPFPIMPSDMAMRICLASSPPLHSFLATRCCSSSSSATLLQQRPEPLRPCLASGRNIGMATPTMSVSSTMTAADVGSILLCPKAQKKKSVVFADSHGLELAMVHVFNEFEDDPLNELQFHLNAIEGARAGSHLGDGKGDNTATD